MKPCAMTNRSKGVERVRRGDGSRPLWPEFDKEKLKDLWPNNAYERSVLLTGHYTVHDLGRGLVFIGKPLNNPVCDRCGNRFDTQHFRIPFREIRIENGRKVLAVGRRCVKRTIVRTWERVSPQEKKISSFVREKFLASLPRLTQRWDRGDISFVMLISKCIQSFKVAILSGGDDLEFANLCSARLIAVLRDHFDPEDNR